MEVKSITTEEFNTLLENQKRLMIVDFWAPWCGPCKAMHPVIEQVAELYKDTVDIYKVNVDEESELSSRYSIRSIPTLIYFNDTQAIKQSIGAILDVKKHVEIIDELLAKK